MHKKKHSGWAAAAGWRDAFGISGSEHIALVGGGGKTTTMWSMARELSRSAATVVTSTTKAGEVPIGIPIVAWAQELPGHDLQASMSTALQLGHLVALTSGARNRRLEGVSPIVVDEVFFRCGASYIINEADGARMLPFKAPAEHEPVIASTTTLAAIVVGLDALGAPIDESHLHRPEQVVAVTGAASGSRLEPEHIASIVRAYLQKMEGLESLRAAVLINKADSGPDDRRVTDLAAALADLDLAAIVAASQAEKLELWALR